MNLETFKREILDTWIEGDESEEFVNEKYAIIDAFATNLYDFVLTYYNYMNRRKDYGLGKPLTMVEVHILTDIGDNPGTTVTELAKKWKKTSSAISQTVRSLLKLNYIRRENSTTDGKVFFLYVTEEGADMVLAHKKYDIIDTIKTNKKLAKKFTAEDLFLFNEILKEYTDLLNPKL
ncbi:MarR family winged helix-turn-helix transcriptional regulator [Anaerosphaera multitolerans]|uniref:MarR family transcriptional regulator n=1 Tax=Anaerosphaera multitolerans TaxID=2487351 RepID=A0A437S9Q1_9FIRM|nr:MarR family transcriptional regulator [Anaerosphaera multitolerans]RVU55712.1 MarR family transcriptional regulator [Anaerosphaera multitolerans]